MRSSNASVSDYLVSRIHIMHKFLEEIPLDGVDSCKFISMIRFRTILLPTCCCSTEQLDDHRLILVDTSLILFILPFGEHRRVFI
jgi:hypothetical protein